MKNTFGSIFFIFLLVMGVVSQGEASQNEAGFIEIEPIDFYFHMYSDLTRLDLHSSPARIWYVHQIADLDNENKPLFVFFNGGPGSATSSGLTSLNTGRWTLDSSKENGGPEFVPNPVSWTQLGNLLHIDARQAGFSYCTMSSASDIGARYQEFGAQNFNAYFDAADFIRVVLRFFGAHPELERNPVVLVGESYGGIRATTMLYILLNYEKFGNGEEIYQDVALVHEIQEHYNRVFPQYANSIVPPEIIAQQFSHQVLIQPAITRIYENQVVGDMFEAENSVIFQLAQTLGLNYVPCRMRSDPNCEPVNNGLYFVHDVAGRDWYNYSRPQEWMNGWFNNATRLLGYTDNLNLLTGTDVTGILPLYAAARGNAYRVVNLNEATEMNLERVKALPGLPLLQRVELISYMLSQEKQPTGEIAPNATGTLTQTFGILQPWDRYYLSLSGNANNAHWFNVATFRGYGVNYSESPHFGYMFLKNVAHVKTFITHAQYDLVVYSEAFPAALAHHTDILNSATHDRDTRPGIQRSGWIILNYRTDAFQDIPNLQNRVIRFPLYPKSGHAVSITEPVELFNDVYAWLFETN